MPYISHYIEKTKLLGPQDRFVVWFQGCNKRCEGCINPDSWEIGAGEYITVNDLLKKIMGVSGIVGITVSGGEPFLQYEELKELVEQVKEKTNLDIMLYSGYKLEELTFRHGESFFKNIDIFIDGSYVDSLNNDNLYRGSENQKIYFFTKKYKKYKKVIESSKNRSVDFEIKSDNEIYLVGIPPKGIYEKVLKKIAEGE